MGRGGCWFQDDQDHRPAQKSPQRRLNLPPVLFTELETQPSSSPSLPAQPDPPGSTGRSLADRVLNYSLSTSEPEDPSSSLAGGDLTGRETPCRPKSLARGGRSREGGRVAGEPVSLSVTRELVSPPTDCPPPPFGSPSRAPGDQVRPFPAGPAARTSRRRRDKEPRSGVFKQDPVPRLSPGFRYCQRTVALLGL